MINMESHAFSCYLGVITFAIGKMTLASLVPITNVITWYICNSTFSSTKAIGIGAVMLCD